MKLTASTNFYYFDEVVEVVEDMVLDSFDYLVEVMVLKSFDELRILVRKVPSSTNFDQLLRG